MHKRIDPFEFLYYIGYFFKKSYLLSRQKKLPCKVISVGNITLGGTGKTPTTIALAIEAKKRGLKPVILTRGYKGNAKEPVFVNFPQQQNFSSDKLPKSEISPKTIGDEAFMMSKKLGDVPIVKYPDRYKGGMQALERLKPFVHNDRIVFILDDGFQHWGLFRDIDIVLVDGNKPFGNRKMLPFGDLRELPRELKRADILVITKQKNEELFNKLKLINPIAPIFYSEYKISDIRYANGNNLPASALKNKKIYAFCGIADPESFKKNLSSLETEIGYFKDYPDHYRYKAKDIQDIRKHAEKLRCSFMITTEKDIVKIREFKDIEGILYMDINFSIEKGFYDRVFNNKE